MAIRAELVERQDEPDWEVVLPPPAYFRDSEWISEHIDELTKGHPDEWIGVVDGRVIASGKDAGAVLRQARRETGRHHVAMQLMQTGSQPWRWPR